MAKAARAKKAPRKQRQPRKPKSENAALPSPYGLALTDQQLKLEIIRTTYYHEKGSENLVEVARKVYEFIKEPIPDPTGPVSMPAVNSPKSEGKTTGEAPPIEMTMFPEEAEVIAPKKHFETDRILM